MVDGESVERRPTVAPCVSAPAASRRDEVLLVGQLAPSAVVEDADEDQGSHEGAEMGDDDGAHQFRDGEHPLDRDDPRSRSRGRGT